MGRGIANLLNSSSYASRGMTRVVKIHVSHRKELQSSGINLRKTLHCIHTRGVTKATNECGNTNSMPKLQAAQSQLMATNGFLKYWRRVE